MSELIFCPKCWMNIGSDEYHPEAACLIFMACRDEKKVREALSEVVWYSMKEGWIARDVAWTMAKRPTDVAQHRRHRPSKIELATT